LVRVRPRIIPYLNVFSDLVIIIRIRFTAFPGFVVCPTANDYIFGSKLTHGAINGGAPETYNAPHTVTLYAAGPSTPADHEIVAYAVDLAGNQSQPLTLNYTVVPMLAVTATPVPGRYYDQVNVTLEASRQDAAILFKLGPQHPWLTYAREIPLL